MSRISPPNATEARLIEPHDRHLVRRWHTDWINLIAKYTKLLELRPTGLGEGLHTDQRSDVGTVMSIIELPFRLQLTEKVPGSTSTRATTCCSTRPARG